MAKGQRRSNREAKKPKQSKPGRGALTLAPASTVTVGERVQSSGRSQSRVRNGGRINHVVGSESTITDGEGIAQGGLENR
jgi:hypothetical protein